MGDKFNIISHTVQAKTDFRILCKCIDIPATHLINQLSSDYIVGTRYGTQLKKEKTSGLVHALIGKGFDVNKSGKQRRILIPGPEFTDYST